MGVEEKAYLHDYLAVGILAFVVSWLSIYYVEYPLRSHFFAERWGEFLKFCFLIGIFGFLLAGFVAGYLIQKMRSVREMSLSEGVKAGFIAFIVYVVISVVISALEAIEAGGQAGDVMAIWGLVTVFGLIFYPIGGYLSSMLAQKKIEIPMFTFIARAPPSVPPPAASTCPTCGKPLTYIQQYSRWYCENCKKYA